MRRTRLYVTLVALLLPVVVLAGCASNPATSADSHPAAQAVERVLQLRARHVTDPSAFAQYFAAASVATALAQSADTTAGAIPGWQLPYVSKATTSTAEVVVVWHTSTAAANWPAASIFTMRREVGGWVIVDASTSTMKAPEPLEGTDD